MFEVGDEVISNVCPTMIGTVIKVFGGTGNMLVRISGNTVLADPMHWRLLKRRKTNGSNDD